MPTHMTLLLSFCKHVHRLKLVLVCLCSLDTRAYAGGDKCSESATSAAVSEVDMEDDREAGGQGNETDRWNSDDDDDDDVSKRSLARPPSPPRARPTIGSGGGSLGRPKVLDRWDDDQSDDDEIDQSAMAPGTRANSGNTPELDNGRGAAMVCAATGPPRKRKRVQWADDEGGGGAGGGGDGRRVLEGASAEVSTESRASFELSALASLKAGRPFGLPLKSALAKPTSKFAASTTDAAAANLPHGLPEGGEEQRKRVRVRGWLRGTEAMDSLNGGVKNDGKNSSSSNGEGASAGAMTAAGANLAVDRSGRANGESDFARGVEPTSTRLKDEPSKVAAGQHPEGLPLGPSKIPTEPKKKDRWVSDSDSE